MTITSPQMRLVGMRGLVPGLCGCGAAVAVAAFIHHLVAPLATLTVAVLLGVTATNLRLIPASMRPGLDAAGKRLMRAGVVLLGLQLALPQIAALGWETVLMVLAVVWLTFAGTRAMGRAMGLSPGLSLLVASGFSICGCSAIAAVRTDEDEQDVVTAMALVTLCGSLAIGVLPLLGALAGMPPRLFGMWAGASVHDVGQVVATASLAGPAALAPAVATKLIRVAMLLPLVTAVSASRRGLPLFLLGFLAMAGLRSTGRVPAGVLSAAQSVGGLCFAASLFCLGTCVRFGALRRTGRRALLLGLGSWALVATVSLGGVLVIGGP